MSRTDTGVPYLPAAGSAANPPAISNQPVPDCATLRADMGKTSGHVGDGGTQVNGGNCPDTGGEPYQLTPAEFTECADAPPVGASGRGRPPRPDRAPTKAQLRAMWTAHAQGFVRRSAHSTGRAFAIGFDRAAVVDRCIAYGWMQPGTWSNQYQLTAKGNAWLRLLAARMAKRDGA